ncbi:MAG: cation-translocating P-type ATPase [Halobacteriales archaeon]|nr:cation-translocating P-type ATPase [Halobacteriales archaeon]
MEEECRLCDLPANRTRVERDGNVFCCRGCAEVYETLGDVDLEERNDTDVDEEEVPEGCETAFLHVDGMHCTACEIFVENTAERHDGVESVSASYPTETVRLGYDDEKVGEEDLPDVVSGAGYTASHKYDEEARKEARRENVGRLLVGGFFGMMAMVWYVFFLYPTYFGYDPLFTLSGVEGVFLFGKILVSATVVLFYTGAPILRGAYVSLRARQPNMDLLVALAALSAYTYSTVALGFGRTDLYYDVTIAVILVVSVGGYYERRVKRNALGTLADLTEVRVEEARRENGTVVKVEEVEKGDRLLVRAGERVPADGFVVEGTAYVDESVVTGESEPRKRKEGDYVVGGSVVTDDAVVVEAEGDGGEGALDRLTNLLWDLQSTETGIQRLADRLATVFVPLVLVVASVALIFRLASGADVEKAALTALTVLIVSCPCALGLATPLAVASGVRTAVENGIVVSDDTVFERVRDVDTVVFDKTGTLTTGKLEVVGVEGDEDVLERASAVERFSAHPVAEAVVRAGESMESSEESELVADGGIGASTAEFKEHEKGVEGVVEGDRVLVGAPSLFEDEGWSLGDVRDETEDAESRGRAVVVGWSGEARGVLTVAEKPRENWHDVVKKVSDEGKRVVVLTGDEGESARRFADAEGVDEVFEGVPPEAKAETVRRLCGEGATAMVGDGTNDAPALAEADLGIAMGGGTALASDAGDMTVLDDDLSKIETVIDISNATRTRTRQNIGWAFLYNTVAVPLAVTGLLNPLLAALAMATSSLLVTMNSSRRLL